HRAPAVDTVGWDPDTRTLARAVERGAVEEAAESARAAVRDADIVVIAAPPSATIPLIGSVVTALSAGAIVTDVGSAKARIVHEAEGLLGSRFVGGHPMAGSERSGIEAATDDLFVGAPWVLTRTAATSEPAIGGIESIV